MVAEGFGNMSDLRILNKIKFKYMSFEHLFDTYFSLIDAELLLLLMILLKEVCLKFRNYYRDSLRAQRFQTLITSLFGGIWVINLIVGLSKG